ncbi:MAG: regulatory protein RecX [Faecousia sp.]
MKVESIEQTRSPSGKLRVRFDNGSSLLIFPSVIAEHGIYSGMELPEAALNSLEESNAAASAKDRAVRIVSATSISKKELEKRLIQKGEREEDAKQAVMWLENLKLLDDKQVAQQIVRNGLSRGYGASRIRQMLYEKRIPKELWEEALSDLPPQDDAIDAFLQRRFHGRKPDRAECKRATDALLRRGHSWNDIRRALERYAPEEEFYEDAY